MAEVRKRNMVERLDGHLVNAGRLRGMLIVCATGCCCGRTERGFAEVEEDFYHAEWERRRLRNRIHLNQGGCLGPCVLANVVMLVIDGRPVWFHSINDRASVLAVFDYIELLLDEIDTQPPPILRPHIFNGFAWNGVTETGTERPDEILAGTCGEGLLFLSQSDTELLTLERARGLLPPGFAELQAAHIGRAEDDESVDALLQRLLPSAQVVVARLLSARSYEYGLKRLKQWAERKGGFLFCLPAVEAFDHDLMRQSNVGVPLAQAINAYLQCGGAENLANGLRCLSDHLLVTGWGFDQPKEIPLHGYYEPAIVEKTDGLGQGGPQGEDADGSVRYPTPAKTSTGKEVKEKISTREGHVGILLYRAHLLSGNTAFVDALATEFTRRGISVCAVYTQSLKECDADGTPLALKEMTRSGPVDAIVSTLSFALGSGDGVLDALDVPVVQAIACSSDREAWKRNGRGLGPLDTAMNVAIPEFDGRIVGVPISFKENEGENGAGYVPDRERVARLVGIVERLTALRRKANGKKRIAVVLTNSAAKAAKVGNAVGLDAPASLLRLLQRMKAAGYAIEGLPATGD